MRACAQKRELRNKGSDEQFLCTAGRRSSQRCCTGCTVLTATEEQDDDDDDEGDHDGDAEDDRKLEGMYLKRGLWPCQWDKNR